MKINRFRTVCFVGMGYIGLPTAAVLASRGVNVIGVDINPEVVAAVNRGEIHIVEPGLDELVASVVARGHLRATTIVEPADAFIIAVPTPFKNDHQPDLAYVESAGRSIAPALKKGDLVVLESTSPVGTTEDLARQLALARPDLRFPRGDGGEHDVFVAYCPERVLPGKVIEELVGNDRVIGGMSSSCSARAVEFYEQFVEGECIVTDSKTAEMCKLTENSFRDVNIAFANELSIVCDKSGINVWELIGLANRHPRVKILRPGPGVGGHCIAVDPWFIVSAAPELTKLIATARKVNDSKPQWVIDKVLAAVSTNGERKKTVACFGLAFKPDIDDFRESPSLEIARQLSKEPSLSVIAVEPHCPAGPITSVDGIINVSPEEAFGKADIIVILVAHTAFKSIDLAQWSRATTIDACGILSE